MNKFKLLASSVALLLIGYMLAACASLDVVGQSSITSFDAVLKTIPDKVSADEINAGWSLSAPDDSARFIWSEDYSRSPLHDVMLEFDAQPFIDAGLDPNLLPEGYVYYQGGMDGMSGMGEKKLMVGKKLGDTDKVSGASSARAAYELIVNKHRDAINYHTSLDHFGVKLGDGNMFEWAKDMRINGFDNSNQDKDIVFVLNPEPLIQAGVDPENVQGWAYAQVSVEENGKPALVWKLLKPFDLVK